MVLIILVNSVPKAPYVSMAHAISYAAIGKRPVVRLELAMSVEKHFTLHDYITSHTMKSYHHTIVLYIRENYDDDDRIES